MKPISSRSVAALVVLLLTGSASAQTTRPAADAAPAPWGSTVEQVAKATELGNVPQVVSLLARDAHVRAFESPDPAAARTLIDAAADWKLLGTHAYQFPPVSLARDIAADVKRSDLVPEADKRKIVPYDDAEEARANTTAADWVAQTLAAERDQLIGVAVFWNTRNNRPMFVLMKGQASGEDYAVKLAVYGDPMARRDR
ncbi:MAG TPA: hypothetical protein VGR35_05520 [Tepidisphaeraceae bacterium]|nr:hypothetical protein [Tepidisphaeraceae bacterium]